MHQCLFIICVIVYNLYYCYYAKTSSPAVQKRHSKVYGNPIAPCAIEKRFWNLRGGGLNPSLGGEGPAAPPLYSPLDTHIKWKFLLIGLKNETLTYSKALIYIYLFKRVLWHSLIMALRFGESLTLTSTKHGWSFYLFITLCSIIRTQSTTMFGMGLRRF